MSRSKVTLNVTGLLLSMLLALPSAASSQLVIGRVLDAADSVGIAGAEVAVVAESTGALIRRVITDANGIFVAPVDAGIILLRVSRLGYEEVETSPMEVGGSERVQVAIHLAAQAVELEPMVVVARRADPRQRDLRDFLIRAENFEEAGINRIYTRQDLEEMDTWRFEEFMTREAPRLGHALPSMTSQGDRCRPLLFWDGSPRDVDPYMSVSSIQGVEFYRGYGPANTRFQNPRGCGVVLVWTRPLNVDPRARPHSKGRLAVAGVLALLILTVKIF